MELPLGVAEELKQIFQKYKDQVSKSFALKLMLDIRMIYLHTFTQVFNNQITFYKGFKFTDFQTPSIFRKSNLSRDNRLIEEKRLTHSCFTVYKFCIFLWKFFYEFKHFWIVSTNIVHFWFMRREWFKVLFSSLEIFFLRSFLSGNNRALVRGKSLGGPKS